VIYPKNFEEKLGFDQIRLLLKQHCLSNLGKEQVDEMRFMTKHANIEKQILLTEEFKHILMFQSDFPTSYFIDLRQALSKIHIEGTFLSQTELFDLKKSLSTIKDIVQFFKNTKEEYYPELKKIAAQFNLYPFIFQRIESILDKYGDIKDSASAELARIRASLQSKRNAISRRVQSVLRKAQEEGIAESDAEITIRDGKMLIPVLATNKRKIPGFIYDQSATGKTFFIEPAEVIELDNEISELVYEERREIIKILTIFSNELRPYLPELQVSYQTLGVFDFIRAKALYAINIDAVKPLIMENKPWLNWQNAKHPGLLLTLKKEKREIVPQDLFFTESNRIILISGPNAGGKSVLLKTVGLIQYMFQCGLQIPVGHNSEAGIFEHIFIDIGDEQSIESDLSTYSSHLINMKHFLKHANDQSIILIDEFGTGTEPLLGGAIAESVLEQLNNQKTYGIITTHYTNLKHFAGNTEGIVNGAMLYDLQNLEPLYKLRVGSPGSSFAFEIAGKIGLPREIIEKASAKIGIEHVNFDKNLKAIERDRAYYQEKRKSIKLLEKKLEKKMAKHDEMMEKELNQRKKIIDDAKSEAQSFLKDLNKKIENTIFEIRQAQAEKEKTKVLRKEIEQIKVQAENSLLEQEDAVLKKMEKLRKKQLEKAQNKKNNQQKNQNTVEHTETDIQEDKKPEVGDNVRIYGQDSTGIIEEIKNKTALVNFGSVKAFISLKTLEIIKKQVQTNHKQPKIAFKLSDTDQTKSIFMFGLDVRGKRTDEALSAVAKYMDEVIVNQASEVKILHGTGNGILRQFIREYLQTVDFVVSVKDEKVELGGTGITVVNLKYR